MKTNFPKKKATLIPALSLCLILGFASCTKIKRPDSSASGSIHLNVCTDDFQTKSFNETSITNYTVMIGPYDRNTDSYGEPERIAQGLTAGSNTFIGISEGEKYIAVLANGSAQGDFNTLTQMDNQRWTLKDVARNEIIPKSGMQIASVTRNSSTNVTITLKQCLSKVYIGKVSVDRGVYYTMPSSKKIYIKNIYLQNVPTYNDNLFFWDESSCPPMADDSGWINVSDNASLTQDASMAALTVRSADAYTSSLYYTSFYSLPNLTDRHTKIVINATESITEATSVFKDVDTYYTVDLPVLLPNQCYYIKQIDLIGTGARSPEDYTEVGSLRYEIVTPFLWNEGPEQEEFL